MYVLVQFQKKNGEFGGGSYTYNSAIPVKTGDYVIAPTQRGETLAKVVEIGIPYEEINASFRDNLRTITNRAEIPEPTQDETEDDFPSLFEEAAE